LEDRRLISQIDGYSVRVAQCTTPYWEIVSVRYSGHPDRSSDSKVTSTASMGHSPPSEADRQEIPALHDTRRFVTAITRARHWTVSWATWIQSTFLHTISL